jgi:hypothetical protein
VKSFVLVGDAAQSQTPFQASSSPEFIIPMARFMADEAICGANSFPNAPKAYAVRQLANAQITERISSSLHVSPLMALFTTLVR